MTMQHYQGSCQCGAVQFEADLDLDGAITCNCSRCRRLGAVLAFTPASGFHQTAGADGMAEYRFNKNVIAHRFCPTCGIETFAMGQTPDGTPIVAVNVNCLEGVDPRALATLSVDGASA